MRERVGEGSGKQLERRLGVMRARASAPVDERAVFAVMRDLAARSRALAVDARRYERELADVVRSLDATLLGEVGVGPISAAKLLVCDPARFTSEAAFARCNGTAPIPASSGKTVRHRLNRGGESLGGSWTGRGRRDWGLAWVDSFSPFTTTFSRQDGEQEISGV